MQMILTPTGYRDILDCAVGDEVCAFDVASGTPIVNRIELIEPVDYIEWCRWWQTEVTVPPFVFYRINGTYTLFREQSIWRNGTNVCHARDLVLGDTIYDDADHPITIASVEEITSDSWYRLEIDGDHSYIADGLTLHNASRFWVLGAGSWDAVTTTNWAAVTNGAGGQTVPGAADTVTFDGSSGGGVVTVNTTVTVQSITCSAHTGTLDFSVNNNNVTLSVGLTNSGSAIRTFRMGNGTWTLTGTGTVWNMSVVTNLTFTANASSMVFSITGTNLVSFNTGGKTYNSVVVSAASASGALQSLTANATITSLSITGGVYSANANVTIGTLTMSPGTGIMFVSGASLSITDAFTLSGSISAPIFFTVGNATVFGNIVCFAGTCRIDYGSIRNAAFSGGATFLCTNSYDCGANSGATITPPSGAGGLLVNPGMTGGMH